MTTLYLDVIVMNCPLPFIYPNCKFKIADCLVTNFHLPKAALTMFMNTLAGKDKIMALIIRQLKKST